MTKYTPFATMVAIASMISAPELLLANTLTPDLGQDGPAVAVGQTASERSDVRSLAVASTTCGPVPGSEAWQIADPASRLLRQTPTTASANEICLSQLLRE